MFGSETYVKCTRERKVEVFEMMCLRNLYNVGRSDGVRNPLMERNSLKRVGHVERERERERGQKDSGRVPEGCRG